MLYPLSYGSEGGAKFDDPLRITTDNASRASKY
jgi:hypothetical protein